MNASVTFWEATAPVKLPTRYCLLIRFHGPRLELKLGKGGISLMPKLPPMLNMSNPNPISSCSKASRGLFVQPWLKSIFTPPAISPSPSLRQSSSRYAIRAGRNSPDKEFRSNLLPIYLNRAWAFLPCSPCRHGGRTISYLRQSF